DREKGRPGSEWGLSAPICQRAVCRRRRPRWRPDKGSIAKMRTKTFSCAILSGVIPLGQLFLDLDPDQVAIGNGFVHGVAVGYSGGLGDDLAGGAGFDSGTPCDGGTGNNDQDTVGVDRSLGTGAGIGFGGAEGSGAGGADIAVVTDHLEARQGGGGKNCNGAADNLSFHKVQPPFKLGLFSGVFLFRRRRYRLQKLLQPLGVFLGQLDSGADRDGLTPLLE